MAALVLGPVLKVAGVWILGKLFTPRTGAGDRPAPLDTAPLDALASGAAPSSAASTQTTSSVPVGPRSSADGQTAFLTEREVDALLSPAPAVSSPAPVVSSPVPASSATSTTTSESVPVGPAPAPSSPAPVVSSPVLTGDVLDSPERAARALHRIATTTTSASRGPLRTQIRAYQAAMGGIVADGLIGRSTAARIRTLTGLRIPGLS